MIFGQLVEEVRFVVEAKGKEKERRQLAHGARVAGASHLKWLTRKKSDDYDRDSGDRLAKRERDAASARRQGKYPAASYVKDKHFNKAARGGGRFHMSTTRHRSSD